MSSSSSSSTPSYRSGLKPVGDQQRKPNSAMSTLDEKTLESQMKQLSSSTRNVKTAKKIARNRDTIHTLLDALNTKPKFTKMVEYSLECLKNLAVDEVSVEEMIDEGTLDVLLNIMKLNPYNEKIQMMINKTIQSFCLNDRLAGLIADKMGCSGFMFSMKKHVEPETLTSTCSVIGKLMKSDKSVEMFVQGGIIPGLKHVVKTQDQNVEVLVSAAACLDRICDNPLYCAEVMDSKIMEDMLNALKHYPENPALVASILSVIGKLAATSPAYIKMLRELGAVDIMVAALDMHPDDEKLNALGARALKFLAEKADMNSTFSVAAGNTQETANALSKMSSLLLVDENVDYLISNQGIAWLISALNSALPEKGDIASKILSSGCRALMRLANDENKIYGIMQQGGVKLLVAIVEGHIDDENVVVSALSALGKMITRKENAVYIVKSGGVRAAVAALLAHPNSERVAKAALELISRVAQYEECVPGLIDVGVLPPVIKVLTYHPTNGGLANTVVTTLGRMAVSVETAGKVSEAGSIPAIIALLNSQPAKDDVNLSKNGMLFLETTALLPKNIEALRSGGAMDAILSAMETHSADNDVQTIGSRTLAMIAGEQQIKQAVDYVNKLSEEYIKNPNSIQSIIDKLFGATKLVGNLAMIDANLAALHKTGAVRALINAFNAAGKMVPGEKRSALLAQAAHGLFRLAKDPLQAGIIVSSGALKTLLDASLKEPENDELAQYVSALAALCSGLEAQRGKLVADGTIENLITLAKAYNLNDAVLANVARTLGNLGQGSNINQSLELAKNICMNGGAEVVCESLSSNLLDKDALLNALAVLNQLAIDEACIQKLIDVGVIDAILNAMRAHPADSLILCACLQTLCKLLISEDIAKEIGNKQGIPLCIKAMREHYQNEPLCEIDMILLDSLASVQENIAKLLEPDLSTIELIKWIGASYQSNQSLKEAMERLLAVLEGGVNGVNKKNNQGGRDESFSVSDEGFDAAKAEVLLTKMRSPTAIDKAESLRMLKGLLSALNDPANAAIMLQKGGLKALSDLMKKYKDSGDDELFHAASSAFLALCNATDVNGKENDKILEMLESPAMIQALCNMLNAHELFPNKPMALSELTKAVTLAGRMKLKGDLVSEVLKNKPLDSLLKMMISSDDPVLLQQAARLLSKLSNNSEAALLLSKLASLRELINAIRRNMKNEEFLKYGVYLLGNLAINDELKSQIGIEGGIQVILQIIDTYPLNAGLVENCCFALAELSFGNEVNVSFIVACKGIQLFLNAMHNHPREADLLDHAVSVLCNLCHNNNNNKDMILKLGGAQAIVDTVLNNFQAVEFLQTSFRTLGNLAYDSKSVTSIIKAGGVQGLVAGMTVHNNELDIIDVAIRVLSNLAQDATSDNMTIMAQEGAVQAIVEAATTFTDKLDIEISALGCLCNLGRMQSNAAMIIKQGGTEATIQAMTVLDYDSILMAQAFKLIKILCQTPPAELDKMHQAGITPAIVAGIKKQNTNRAVINHGMGAIALLSYNSENAIQMAEANVLQVILKLVQENISNPAVLSDCFPALSSLARAEGNAVSMSELAMTALSTCISTAQSSPTVGNPESARFLNICFAFLANLCVHSDATEGIIKTKLVDSSINVMHKFVGQPDVLLRGLKSLENMCFSTDAVKDHLKANGIVEGVNKISTDNITIDDVKRQCKAVLDALNRSKFDLEIGGLKLIQLKNVDIKSAKELFGDVEKKIEVVKELPESIRNLLFAGAMITKHSNSAAPRTRHVYVTSDLKFLVWKDPKAPLHPDNKMKVSRIRTVERGRCTPQLERKSFGKFLAKENCAWAVLGRDRTVDLESPTEKDRDIWVHAMEMLVAYRKELKRVASQFHTGQ